MGEWKALKKASGTGWKELERESGTGWKALLWELFFEDDFETGNLNKWTSAGAYWSVQSTTKYEGTYAAQGSGGAVGAERRLKKALSLTHGKISFRWRKAETNQTSYLCLPTDTDQAHLYWVVAKDNGHLQYYDGSYHNFPNDKTFVANTWYLLEVEFNYSTDKYRVWHNSSEATTGTGLSIYGSGTAMTEFKISSDNAGTTYIDNVIIEDLS